MLQPVERDVDGAASQRDSCVRFDHVADRNGVSIALETEHGEQHQLLHLAEAAWRHPYIGNYISIISRKPVSGAWGLGALHRTSACGLRPYLGTLCFSSSNQLSTKTLILCVVTDSGVPATPTRPRCRCCQADELAVGVVSYARRALGGPSVNDLGTGVGLLNANVGCLTTVTASNPPARGL